MCSWCAPCICGKSQKCNKSKFKRNDTRRLNDLRYARHTLPAAIERIPERAGPSTYARVLYILCTGGNRMLSCGHRKKGFDVDVEWFETDLLVRQRTASARINNIKLILRLTQLCVSYVFRSACLEHTFSFHFLKRFETRSMNERVSRSSRSKLHSAPRNRWGIFN